LRGGMVVLSCLWLAVAATTVAFWGHDWVSGLMFAPYLLWVSVAGALNFTVWRMNPAA
jgi:translocator protein